MEKTSKYLKKCHIDKYENCLWYELPYIFLIDYYEKSEDYLVYEEIKR